MALHVGDPVQFRFEPGTGGVILAIAPDSRASVQTRGNRVREVPTSALVRVRPEHEERTRRLAFRDRSHHRSRDDGDRAANFIRDLQDQLDVGDRQVRMRSERGSVFINYINLPSGVGAAGGGAEAENNRMLLVVRGFDRAREPGAKVKVETLVSNLYKNNVLARENRVNVRARTGTDQTIARYVAETLNLISRSVPPNFTHTNRDRMRRRFRSR